jgi:hypothetical protein
MAIVIKDNFNLGAAKPIDSRLSIGKFSELLAKNYSVYDSYAGMLVYVEEDETIGSGESATTYKKGYYKLNSYVEENADTAASWQYLPALSGSTTIEGTIENAQKAEKDGLGNVISESYVSGAKVNGSNIELNAKSGTTLATIKPADVIEFSSDDSNNIVIGHKESAVKGEDITKDEVLATVKTDAYGHIVSATQLTATELADYKVGDEKSLSEQITGAISTGEDLEINEDEDGKLVISHVGKENLLNSDILFSGSDSENLGYLSTFIVDGNGHIEDVEILTAADLMNYNGNGYSENTLYDEIKLKLAENFTSDLYVYGNLSSDNVTTVSIDSGYSCTYITVEHNTYVNEIDINDSIGEYAYQTNSGYTFGRGYLTLSAIDYDETGHISAAKTLTSTDLLNYTSGADDESTLKELIVDVVNTDLEKLKEGQEITVDNENKFWITGITTSTDETEEDASISASQVINTSAYIDVDNGSTTLHIDAISPVDTNTEESTEEDTGEESETSVKYVKGTIESATKLSKKINIEPLNKGDSDKQGITFEPIETDFSKDIYFNFASIDFDGLLIQGIIPIENLPQAALERCVVVGTVEEMLSLDSDDIQTGDTVKVSGGYVASTEGEYVLDGDDYREYNEDTDTDLPHYTYEQPAMYFVKDTEKLGTLDAFEVYYAGNSATADVANRIKNGLTIKVDGTSNYYDGSSAKTIEIKSTEVSVTPVKESGLDTEAIATISINGEETKIYADKNITYDLDVLPISNTDIPELLKEANGVANNNILSFRLLETHTNALMGNDMPIFKSFVPVLEGDNVTLEAKSLTVSGKSSFGIKISSTDEKVIAEELTATEDTSSDNTTNLTAYLLATTNTDKKAHTVNYVKNITADLNGVLTANEFKGNINVNYLTQAEVTEDTDYATYEDMLVFDCGSASGF